MWPAWEPKLRRFDYQTNTPGYATASQLTRGTIIQTAAPNSIIIIAHNYWAIRLIHSRWSLNFLCYLDEFQCDQIWISLWNFQTMRKFIWQAYFATCCFCQGNCSTYNSDSGSILEAIVSSPFTDWKLNRATESENYFCPWEGLNTRPSCYRDIECSKLYCDF